MPQRPKETRREARQIRVGHQIADWNLLRYRPRILPVDVIGPRPADRWRPPQELQPRGPVPPAHCNLRHSRRWPDIGAKYQPAEGWKNRWPGSAPRVVSCRAVP